jgi:hypothetical protein
MRVLPGSNRGWQTIMSLFKISGSVCRNILGQYRKTKGLLSLRSQCITRLSFHLWHPKAKEVQTKAPTGSYSHRTPVWGTRCCTLFLDNARKWPSADCCRYVNFVRSERWGNWSYLWCRYNYDPISLYPLLTLTGYKRVLTPVFTSSLLALCDLWLIYMEKTTKKNRKEKSKNQEEDTTN